MARPEIEIDAKLVEDLAAIYCTKQEMAAIVGCSVDTLDRRFAEVIEKGRQRGKTTLRRKQFEAAVGGNIVMLIWLGKQILGQVDKTQIDITKIDDAAFIEEARRRLGNAEDGPRDVEALLIKEPDPVKT